MDDADGKQRVERIELLRSMSTHVAVMETSALPAAVRSLLSTDFTLQQLKVLTVLVTVPEGETVRDLAATFSVSTASMSTMVDRLVAQGAARRGVDPLDARVRRIQATTLGRDVVQKLVGARPEFAEAVLGRLPLEDLRALERGMRALAAALAAVGGAAGPAPTATSGGLDPGRSTGSG